MFSRQRGELSQLIPKMLSFLSSVDSNLLPILGILFFQFPNFRKPWGSKLLLWVVSISYCCIRNTNTTVIQQEVFLTLCLRVSGGGFASDCRSSGHLGQLCITPVFWGPCFSRGHSRSRTANSAAQAPL